MGCSRAHCATTHVHHQVRCLVIWWVHIYQYTWVSSMWAKFGQVGGHCQIASILHQHSCLFIHPLLWPYDWCDYGGFSSRSCDVGALVRCTDTLCGPTQPGGEGQGKCNMWNTYIAVHTKNSFHSCWLATVWKSLKIVQMKCILLCANAGIWLVCFPGCDLWATILYYNNITSHLRLLFCT